MAKENMAEEKIRGIRNSSVPLEKFKIMMGTEAYHNLGNISRDDYDWFLAESQTPDYWVGQWRTGFGFINVVYPKSTSRELTEEELVHYKSQKFSIGGL